MGNKFPKYLLLMGASFLVVVVLVVASRGIAINYANGLFVKWENIGPPPEPVEEFQAVSFINSNETGLDASLYTKVSDGSLYQGSPTICSINKDCWRKVEHLPDKTLISKFEISDTCEISYKNATKPPGIVTVCVGYEDQAAGSHLIRTAHFAQLSDGTIWTWQFIPGQAAAVIFLFGIVVSIFFAVVFFIAAHKQIL